QRALLFSPPPPTTHCVPSKHSARSPPATSPARRSSSSFSPCPERTTSRPRARNPCSNARAIGRFRIEPEFVAVLVKLAHAGEQFRIQKNRIAMRRQFRRGFLLDLLPRRIRIARVQIRK